MENKVNNIDTRVTERDGQPLTMVVMGLNVYDLSRIEEFLPVAIDAFKNQRMCSPPDTGGLFVTLMGELTSEEFCRRWIAAAESDPILKHFMSEMQEATVLHGEADGTVISHLSLLS